MPEIVLPDGTRIGDQVLAAPSVDAQILAKGLQHILIALNGVQMQLDMLIRMESNETTRAEVKSRIRRADDAAAEKQLRDAAAVEEVLSESEDSVTADSEDR